jgi:hypothetical protein
MLNYTRSTLTGTQLGAAAIAAGIDGITLCVNHSAVHTKLPQHCAVLQNVGRVRCRDIVQGVECEAR